MKEPYTIMKQIDTAHFFIPWYLKSINWICFVTKDIVYDPESCYLETSLM